MKADESSLLESWVSCGSPSHHNITSLKGVALLVELGDLDMSSKPSVCCYFSWGIFSSVVKLRRDGKESLLSRVVNLKHLHFHYKFKQKGIRTWKLILQKKILREKLVKVHVEIGVAGVKRQVEGARV